ncbi:unnamed protein product [Arctia plantaginis]|uniref:BRCT domain-containing protein n=1 Tax=Arctia plantaginis TaxID=874455 RepID=A0A8S0Z7W0_ARCPL|nr:unnamed protein product [Arctia plantaginis]CAB3228170.1 unnamed protein product [Arctia plantaginis]
MPRVKIDYIVSFSSEDPEHPASNLLAWEVSKKKWLCKKGESSCSVVLQLTKAVKISSVHIGAYHSALVEVLVARSEKASDQYQVLVPSCVFVSPAESRRDEPAERVRSFGAEQLASDARAQRWDRVRVVCSQPYNKHCKYGLSFIHIDEPGDDPAVPQPQAQPAATPIPKRVLALDTFSSDEDDFRPGELFAKHLQKNSDSQSSSSDTGAQIRQATSQALKNISESSTKLMKTPINKPSSRRDTVSTSAGGSGRSDRSRDTLLYTNDDERPHAKIDQVVQRHKEQKQKEDKTQMKVDKKERSNGSSHRPREENHPPKRRKSSSPTASETPPSKRANKNSDSSSDRKKREEKRNKPHAGSEESEQEGEECSEPHTILSGVVLVLSGYENPERANVRNTALALGALVQRDWGPSCTHLV